MGLGEEETSPQYLQCGDLIWHARYPKLCYYLCVLVRVRRRWNVIDPVIFELCARICVCVRSRGVDVSI